MVFFPSLLDCMDEMLEASHPSTSFAVSLLPRDLQKLKHVTRKGTSPRRCPARRQWNLDKKITSGGVEKEKDAFQVSVDVEHFAPNEISVKTVDNTIVVEGKHEEKEDGQGFISRHFLRRYQLPEDFDVEQVTSALSSDGILTIQAPKVVNAIEGKERVIQINHTGPAARCIQMHEKGGEEVEKEVDSVFTESLENKLKI